MRLIIRSFCIVAAAESAFHSLLKIVKLDELVSFFLFFRWHHIESLLSGGVTITVNFWYKVCTFESLGPC